MYKERTVNESAVKKCLDYMKGTSRYSLESFLNEHNLLENAKTQGNNLEITCPFHEDYSPSLSVNLDKEMYKCFSCGRGGGSINFKVEYLNELEGSNYTFYTYIEKLLKSDRLMQFATGVNTIFIKTDESIELGNFKRFVPTLETSNEPTNYLELAGKLKSDNNITTNQKLYFISLMTKGISPTEIYKDLYDIKEKDTSDSDIELPEIDFTSVNIMDMLGGI